MKKILSFVLFLTLMLSFPCSLAEEKGTDDLAGMSIDELLELRKSIDNAIYEQGGKIILPPGELLVGRDISAGSYLITPYNFREDYNGWAWSLYVYKTVNSKNAYNQADREYSAAYLRAISADDGDTDVEYPAEIDETQYFDFKDSFTNKVSQRITLEEGQVLEVKPWSNDPTLELAIEKAALPPKGAKRQLAFYGGSFTAIPVERQIELLSAAKKALDRGEIDSVRLSTRPDAVDETVLDRLASFGVDTVEIGAQSMDEEVLRLSGRGHTAEDVVRASRLIRERGFSLILQMMTGLPGDTPERDVDTAKRLIALHPEGVRIYPTVIVKDTALYELWQRGHYTEHTVEDAVSVCALLLPLFERAGIPVIRLGLNPTDELSGGEAVGGAYHPALGELAKSRILLNRARELLRGIEPGASVRIRVPSSQLSQMIGQKRENIRRLREEFSLRDLKVSPLSYGEEGLRIEVL